MYGSIDPRVFILLGIVSVSFLSGWFINGWRWEARYESLQGEYAEAMVRAQKEARRQEIELNILAGESARRKDAEISSIRGQLDGSLVKLRNRPSRNPDNSADPKGSSGAELSREDAEFLAREAARADEAVAALLYCYRMYDSVHGVIDANKHQ